MRWQLGWKAVAAVAVAESAEAAELECAALRRAGAHAGSRTGLGACPPENGEWARRTELQRERVAGRLMQRCASRLLREICTAWVPARHMRAQRQSVHRALAAKGRRGVGSCFCGWAAGVRRQRLRRRAVAKRLQSRQRSGVSWAFRSWLAEITRVRDKQLRKSSTLVWDRHEKAREGLLGRVAENLARVINARSTRACFSSWCALVRDSGGARWRQQHVLYAARRLRRWKITMAFRRWGSSAAGSKWSAAASDAVAQQQAAAESRELLVHAQERLEQMEQRVFDAEEAAAAAEENAATQKDQIRNLQKRLKLLTLANSERAESESRQRARLEMARVTAGASNR